MPITCQISLDLTIEITCGMYLQVDLVGGYYDSGDHVKFGLPMAFAVTMLSWSTIEFEKEIATANQLEYALEAIHWGTDYFMKAHKQPDTFWAQVKIFIYAFISIFLFFFPIFGANYGGW